MREIVFLQQEVADSIVREIQPELNPMGTASLSPKRQVRKHSGQMKRVLSELSAEELRSLEVALKRLGKRAAALMEES